MSKDKLNLINEIIDYIVSRPYVPEEFAKYVYVKAIDERSYRYGDKELNRLMDILGGMSAGEEFFYSKEEVVEMLRSYVSTLK